MKGERIEWKHFLIVSIVFFTQAGWQTDPDCTQYCSSDADCMAAATQTGRWLASFQCIVVEDGSCLWSLLFPIKTMRLKNIYINKKARAWRRYLCAPMQSLWGSSRQGCCGLLLLLLRAAGWQQDARLQYSPCSRSCWSYHGSSSSVTNSSIVPELSMGLTRTALEKQAPPCACVCVSLSSRDRNNGAPWGSGGSFKAELRVRRPGGESCCWASGPPRRVSSSASSGHSHLSVPSTAWSEAPQMLGLLQTWQRCCNSGTSFSPPPPPTRYQLRPRGAFAYRSSDARLRFCSYTPSAWIGAKHSAPSRWWNVSCDVIRFSPLLSFHALPFKLGNFFLLQDSKFRRHSMHHVLRKVTRKLKFCRKLLAALTSIT